jgi:hypothetical protein
MADSPGGVLAGEPNARSTNWQLFRHPKGAILNRDENRGDRRSVYTHAGGAADAPS